MCSLFFHNLILKQKDEIRMNSDIMWFSRSDKRREWKKQHIKDVEKDLRETVNHELPMTSIPRTDAGFLNLTTKSDGYGRGIPPVSCLISFCLN